MSLVWLYWWGWAERYTVFYPKTQVVGTAALVSCLFTLGALAHILEDAVLRQHYLYHSDQSAVTTFERGVVVLPWSDVLEDAEVRDRVISKTVEIQGGYEMVVSNDSTVTSAQKFYESGAS